MTKRAKDTSSGITRTKEILKERLESRETGLSFSWKNVPISVDWIESTEGDSLAIVEAKIGRLPIARQNPVGRQHALILASHHGDQLGGRFVVRRSGQVIYRARMRLAQPHSLEERATLAARLAIRLQPCVSEMRAYLLSGVTQTRGGRKTNLADD